MKENKTDLFKTVLAAITFFLSGVFLFKKARPHVESFIEKKRSSN